MNGETEREQFREAVLVQIKLVDGDPRECTFEDHCGTLEERDRLRDLARAVEDELLATGVGVCDGDEFGDGWGTIFFYGPDASAMFDVVWPIVRNFPCREGSYVMTCSGPEAEDVFEARDSEFPGLGRDLRRSTIEVRTDLPLREGDLGWLATRERTPADIQAEANIQNHLTNPPQLHTGWTGATRTLQSAGRLPGRGRLQVQDLGIAGSVYFDIP